MRSLLSILLLLSMLTSANAAVNLAVSQQSGAVVQERAGQLARQLSSKLGTVINVVVLPDAVQVEAWLNRYATAELALVENTFVAGKPGQFVVIGPGGDNLTLIGRQGIAGDLPQRIALALEETGGRSVAATSSSATVERAKVVAPPQPPPIVARKPSSSKSVSEDQYYVIYVYRERLNRQPDQEHLEYWTQQLQSGAVTKQQLLEVACDLEKKSCNLK